MRNSSPINNTNLKELAKILASEKIEVPEEEIFDSAVSIVCFVCSNELKMLRKEEQ